MNNENFRKSIAQQPQGLRESVGIGYISIPNDQNREDFIKRCYRTGTVSILTENGEFLNDIKIGVNSLNFISFPDSVEELGSLVGWVNEPIHNVPIIFDVFQKLDEPADHDEEEFSFYRTFNNSSVHISGNAKEGSLFIDVDSEGDDGQFNVVVNNSNQSAEFNLLTKGKINLEAVGETRLKNTQNLILEVSEVNSPEESLVKIEKGQIKINSSKIVHNDGSEPMMLGDTFKKQFFDQLLLLLFNTKVTTLLGQQPLINFTEFERLRQMTQQFLSTNSKLK